MANEISAELRQKFINGMSQAACTVNVVTTDGPHGRQGVTVSAMSSVSADTEKPSLLVCVHHLGAAAEPIIKNKVFSVNLLQENQIHVSNAFAGRLPEGVTDKFETAEWETSVTGAPLLRGSMASFDCRLHDYQQVGTHYVFYGFVENVITADEGQVLVYANRGYGKAVALTA